MRTAAWTWKLPHVSCSACGFRKIARTCVTVRPQNGEGRLHEIDLLLSDLRRRRSTIEWTILVLEELQCGEEALSSSSAECLCRCNHRHPLRNPAAPKASAHCHLKSAVF